MRCSVYMRRTHSVRWRVSVTGQPNRVFVCLAFPPALFSFPAKANNTESCGNGNMVLRNRAPAVLLAVLLLLVQAAAAGAVEEAALPMELYFSAAELARNAGYGEEPVSSVSMSGQVTCELCLQPGSDLLTFELPGAKVAGKLHQPSR
ncbi:hypothetical protein BS78_01G257800 [Paspalum vaginatum]|nr:hypothetical protein BS78_01G257800 [Paspalum vaginatum]